MNRQWLPRDTIAILVAILFLGLGFVAVWLSMEFLKLEGDAVLVSLLLLPIIVYLIFSGRLGELRVGSLEAKFVNVARESVELAAETVEPSPDDMQIVEKMGRKELERQIERLDESKSIILTLTLGKEGYYNRDILLRYVEALLQYRTFRFVVILDREKKFVAYIPSWAMLQILRVEALGYEFVSMINSGNVRELRQYRGVITRTISTKSTNADALREMTAQDLEALVVIDDDRRLKGVVEREQLLSKLLLAMVR